MPEGFKINIKGPPARRIVELICKCGEIREAILDNSGADPSEEDKICSVCKSTVFTRRTGAPHPTTCHDSAVRSETLKQRSLDHSKKHMKKNWDRQVDMGKIKP